MRRRLLTGVGIVAGLAVAAIVAAVAFASLQAPPLIQPNSSLTPENCSPGPCANVQGFTLWVSNVHVDGDLVRMQVKFKNSSASTHASPEDLQLIDANRQSSGVVTGVTGCNTWTRHEFTNGATFGPIDVCFRAANTSHPVILRWSPDLGLFCCETDLTISLT
jgi:hypothetical protein